jgi:Tol biopolymer transport system component
MRLRRIATGVAVILSGTLVLGGATAQGSHPGANGKIAFQGVIEGEGLRTIKTINPDGTALVELLDGDPNPLSGWDWYAESANGLTTAWSADGATLAFYAYPGGPTHPQRPLCSNSGSIWSVVPEAGGDIENLSCSTSQSGQYYPSSMSWSPDGSQIVLDDTDAGDFDFTRIGLLDVDTGAVSTLLENRQPHTFDPACSTELDFATFGAPSWSPLGDLIAFAVHSSGYLGGCPAINGIWTMAPDGSGLTQLTTGTHGAPDWSPDGSKILFVEGPSAANPPWAEPGPIYVVDADGGAPTLIRSGSSNRNPVWSPDGTKIAFSVDLVGVHVMDADGDNVVVVPNTSDVSLGHISWQPLTAPPDPDDDDDGVDDAIDTGAGAFDDGSGTAGSITDANGLDVLVSDAQDGGDGVTITVTGSSAIKASFTICGFPIKVSGGSEIVITCGSVTVEVVEGAAEIELGDGVVVYVPAGGAARVTDEGGTFYEVENLGQTDVTVTVDGAATVVPAGETSSVSSDVTDPTLTCVPTSFLLNQPAALVTATVSDGESGPAASAVSASADTSSPGSGSVQVTGSDQAGNSTTVSCGYSVGYAFSGFFQPVDNPPTVNSAKAGQTVPVKWRIADYFGVGVSTSASFVSMTSGSITCDSSDPQDGIETYAGGSGLQYQSNGTWQFNWKTPKSYAGQCRVMRLNLADGAGTRVAEFRFK